MGCSRTTLGGGLTQLYGQADDEYHEAFDADRYR